MKPTTHQILVFVFIFLSSFFLLNGVGWAAYQDLEDNWAREAVLELEKEGLLVGFRGDEFLPATSIDQELGLATLTESFQLSQDEQITLFNWLEKTFVQDPGGLTRGEFVAALANVLGLGDTQMVPAGWYPSFSDLSLDYPGFLAVEFVQRLGLLPGHMLVRFEPHRLLTRGEMAYLLHGALKLDRYQGSLLTFNLEQNQIIIQDSLDNQRPLRLLVETLYLTSTGLEKGWPQGAKDGQQVDILARDDKILFIALEQDTTPLAFLQGVNNITKLLADVLTPEQVSAIIAGDWEQLNEEVRYELYEELVKRGAAPWEADALLKQDWGNLQTMIQERLTYEAAAYLRVTPELVHSAVTRNWPKLLEYAQIELAQRLLTSDWLQGITNN